MNKIVYSLFGIKSNSGLVAINVECRQFGKSIFIDTNVRVFNDEWDSINGLVINNPNARKLNLLIRAVIYYPTQRVAYNCLKDLSETVLRLGSSPPT